MATIDRLTNVLVYQDISAAHDFLVEAFGFTPGGVERDGEGNAVHAEVRAGDTAIWLHRVAPEHQMRSPKELPAVSGGLYVYVDDVDAHFERARAAGAQTDTEPRTLPYGMYEYGARDTEGHHWWFGSPVST